MPSSTATPVQMILSQDLTHDDALLAGQLLVTVWPKPNVTVDDRAEQLLSVGRQYEGQRMVAPRSFIIRDSGEIIAHAQVFPRTIFSQDRQIEVAALAKVCTAPNRRGENLGGRIVRAVFELVDRQLFEFALFQTTPEVRPFYERLGAAKVENRFFNPSADDPEENPFWDTEIMCYPADRPGWPDGPINLGGPAY